MHRTHRVPPRKDAFDILDERYARGEITVILRKLASKRTIVDVMKLTMRPQWETSASSNDPQTLPAAFDDLGAHAHKCDAAIGRWFDVLRKFDAFQAFLAPRPISVLVAVSAFALTVLWIW
ncbi:MAG: hypothetical protein ABI460_08395 [Caldimonas sp.]